MIGDDPYTAALASVLDAIHHGPGELRGDPPSDVVEWKPWRGLKHAFLVVGESTSTAEALRHHQRVWEWLEKLSPDSDQHDLAFILILPPQTPEGSNRTIASALCLTVAQLPANGHAIWRRSGSLRELLAIAAQVVPKDLLTLTARQAKDVRRAALQRLVDVVGQDDPVVAHDAARAVLDAFGPSAYDLDLFCCPPRHHSCGNLLLEWLRAGVSGPATLQWLAAGREVGNWLDVEFLGKAS